MKLKMSFLWENGWKFLGLINFTDNCNLSIILHSLRKINFILSTASRTAVLVVTGIRAYLFYCLIVLLLNLSLWISERSERYPYYLGVTKKIFL